MVNRAEFEMYVLLEQAKEGLLGSSSMHGVQGQEKRALGDYDGQVCLCRHCLC